MFQVYNKVIHFIYVYSFSGSFHYRLLQDIEYSFPVLYSRLLLFIYFIYKSVYLLTPNSQFIPSSTFPFGNHKCVFYVCESVSVL